MEIVFVFCQISEPIIWWQGGWIQGSMRCVIDELHTCFLNASCFAWTAPLSAIYMCLLSSTTNSWNSWSRGSQREKTLWNIPTFWTESMMNGGSWDGGTVTVEGAGTRGITQLLLKFNFGYIYSSMVISKRN